MWPITFIDRDFWKGWVLRLLIIKLQMRDPNRAVNSCTLQSQLAVTLLTNNLVNVLTFAINGSRECRLWIHNSGQCLECDNIMMRNDFCSHVCRLDNRNRAIGKRLTPQYSKERKKELLFGAQWEDDFWSPDILSVFVLTQTLDVVSSINNYDNRSNEQESDLLTCVA